MSFNSRLRTEPFVRQTLLTELSIDLASDLHRAPRVAGTHRCNVVAGMRKRGVGGYRAGTDHYRLCSFENAFAAVIRNVLLENRQRNAGETCATGNEILMKWSKWWAECSWDEQIWNKMGRQEDWILWCCYPFDNFPALYACVVHALFTDNRAFAISECLVLRYGVHTTLEFSLNINNSTAIQYING